MTEHINEHPVRRVVQSNLIAHRGASHYAPENTLAAIELAADMGAEWVEVDVAATKDRQLVILHDESLDRTTNGSGRLIDLTLKEVRALDAGSWFSAQFAGERVPTLTELLETVLARDLKLQLELKPSEHGDDHAVLTDLVLEEVAATWKGSETGNIFFSSFSEVCMQMLAANRPDVARAVAVEGVPTDAAGLMERADAQILHVFDLGDPLAEFAELTASGIEVGVATINDPTRGRELLDAGIQTLITDKPDLFE